MENIFQQMWQLAKPFYEEGRPMDIDHIEWFMETAEMVCQKENLDASLLMPLAILHDVGYSQIDNPRTADYYLSDIRRAHMDAGARIAGQILTDLGYPQNKTEKIVYYISVHDNWAFGEVDLYKNDQILGTFKDLDYLWIFTEKGFKAIQPVLGKNDQEMLEHLKAESSPIGGQKPFSNETTKRLHDEYLQARESDLFPKFPSKEVK